MGTTNLNLSGKIGDFIYRRRNGKTVVCLAPVSYKKPMDKTSIRNRSRFSKACSLARAINSIPELKLIWHAYTQNKMSPFNLILKSNYNAISDEQSYNKVVIIPPGFDKYSLSPIYKKPTTPIKYIRHTTPNGKFPEFPYTEKLAQIILAKDPKVQGIPDYYYLSFISSPSKQTKSGFSYTNFTSDFDEVILSRYSTLHLFYTFIQFSSENIPLQSSNTLYGIINNFDSPIQ